MKILKLSNARSLVVAAVLLLSASIVYSQGGRPPDHEIGYFNGRLYAFTASDWLPQRAPLKVQSNIFVVVYPIGWEGLGLFAPFCNPCDHGGNGITFDDFHDHVFDSEPGSPGWSPLRHVNVIMPNYSFLAGLNDPVRDAAVSAAYANHIPTTSFEEVQDLLGSTAPDGSPLAVRIDAGFYIHASLSGRKD